MYDKLRDFASMMGKAGQLKERMEKIQAELGDKIVEADSGAGAVRVTANAKMEILSIHMDQPILQSIAGQGDQADHKVIEDLVTAAVNAALNKARLTAQQELGKIGSDLGLPGMPNMQELMGGVGGGGSIGSGGAG